MDLDRDNSGCPQSPSSNLESFDSPNQRITSNRIFRYGWILMTIGIGCFVTKSLYVALTPGTDNLTIIYLAAGCIIFSGSLIIFVFWNTSRAMSSIKSPCYYYGILTLTTVLPLISFVICIINAVAGINVVAKATNIVLSILFMAASAIICICMYEVSQNRRATEPHRSETTQSRSYIIPVAWDNPPPYHPPPTYRSNPPSAVDLRSTNDSSQINDNELGRPHVIDSRNDQQPKTYLVIASPPSYDNANANSER
ncbi:hypothetical protein TrispH2_004459 [Trichoplax sp. H2]|nr:hypothetical protein TrispH2_004459 [Trichoplax sp. H2]|eukprot:RDD43276.1 hypothetical protein TrispH2_004459 [Trichoplax sp. H2]